jgi:hypothetical protein
LSRGKPFPTLHYDGTFYNLVTCSLLHAGSDCLYFVLYTKLIMCCLIIYVSVQLGLLSSLMETQSGQGLTGTCPAAYITMHVLNQGRRTWLGIILPSLTNPLQLARFTPTSSLYSNSSLHSDYFASHSNLSASLVSMLLLEDPIVGCLCWPVSEKRPSAQAGPPHDFNNVVRYPANTRRRLVLPT